MAGKEAEIERGRKREERRGEEGEGRGGHGKGGDGDRELSTVPSFSSKDTSSIKLGRHTYNSSFLYEGPVSKHNHIRDWYFNIGIWGDIIQSITLCPDPLKLISFFHEWTFISSQQS